MNRAGSTSREELRGRILRETSRSFYLSIRVLPAAIRDPIALAYLLARATDTIADTAEIDVQLRTDELARLASAIQGSAPDPRSHSFERFAAFQQDAAERALIEAVPDCLLWLESLSAADRDDVRRVLTSINEGQTLDVQQFGNTASVTALANAAELDRYTFLVAGSVGEFWTRVCMRHLPKFSSASSETMLSWGVDYGKGLQLVNILRDVGADLRAGRCYLPAQELQQRGITAEQLVSEPARATPLLGAWRLRAEQGIAAGVEYACAIKPWRVRLATALPALLAARTLTLLRDAGAEVFERKIKVPRTEVRQILLKAIGTLAAPRTIRKLHAHLSS